MDDHQVADVTLLSSGSPQQQGSDECAPDTERNASGLSQDSDLVRAKQELDRRTTSATTVDAPIIPVQAAHDPFGDESGGVVKYKTMEWWHVGLLLIAETVSLGILSLPSVMAAMGFLPGVLLIAGIDILASYTGYVIGQFKQAFPGVHSFADAGLLIFGRFGKEFAEICQIFILLFIMAAHILTFSMMKNVLTGHGTCTIVFAFAGMTLSWIMTLPRTLKHMSYISIFSCISIIAAVIITMFGVSFTRPGVGSTYIDTPSNLTSFEKAAVGVSEIVIAFTGHVAFFGFIAELKKPREFPKALCMLQTVAITFYVTVAVVVYYYAGEVVRSPALGSASDTVKKVAYAIAAPTIVIAGVINAHVCVKTIYVRIWRNTNVMSERSMRSCGSWALICTAVWVLSFIIASAIPVFNNLLGLVGAFFCTWFSFGIPAVLWMYMNKGKYFIHRGKTTLCVFNMVILLMSFAICILGTYGSAKEIVHSQTKHGPFSCADNSSR